MSKRTLLGSKEKENILLTLLEGKKPKTLNRDLINPLIENGWITIWGTMFPRFKIKLIELTETGKSIAEMLKKNREKNE